MNSTIVCPHCGQETFVLLNQNAAMGLGFACQHCRQPIQVEPKFTQQITQEQSGQELFKLHLPKRIKSFYDLERIAGGGMGDVYLAKQSGMAGLERKVCLKVLHPHLARNERFAQALVDEAKITVRMRHPNIVQMYNLEREGDLLFCVMEYVPGESLSQIQKNYRSKGALVPISMALYVAIKTLDGLGYAHNLTDQTGQPLQVVHRDISPQNILVTQSGWVKIIDFGIAKATSRVVETRTGMVKGKFAYMAPEQFKGGADHRADLFALGVVLWEMLTGEWLFWTGNEASTVHQVLYKAIPLISEKRSDVPPELDRVLQKALSRDPATRYLTAEAFKNDLVKLAGQGTNGLETFIDLKGEFQDTDPAVSFEEVEEDTFEDPIQEPKTTLDPIEPSELDFSPAQKRVRPKTPHRKALWVGMALALLVFGGAVLFFLKNRTHPVPESKQPVSKIELNSPKVSPEDYPKEKPQKPTEKDSVSKTNLAQQYQQKIRPVAKPQNLTQATISRIFQRNGKGLQGCANQHLEKQGTLSSVKLTVKFSIAQNGKVEAVKLLPESLASTPFGACLIQRVKKIVYPVHDHHLISISFPLEFENQK